MLRPALSLALMIGMTPVAMAATAPAKPAAPAATTRADIDAAAFKLRVIISALQSDTIEKPLKNVFFACLYENPMGKINAEADRVLTANKLSKTDTNDVLAVLASVCGYRPAAAAKSGATPPSR